MNFFKHKLYLVIVFGLVLSVFSCTSSDEYLKLIKDGEISYTGKVDSLKFFSGRNRVKIEGLIVSDPKIVELRVYWNNKKDSVVKPINRTSGIDVVSDIIENLPENIYNFEVKTFDAKGNSSISQKVTAQTYGMRYQTSLIDRKIVSSILSSDFSLVIDFASMDLTTGAFATEIVYMDNNNVEHTISVPVTDSKTVIPNYKSGTRFKHRSLFKPATTSIDIFYTEFVNVTPIPPFAAITVVNGDFSQPNVAKQVGWENIPGWNSDIIAYDSGVQNSGRGYLQSIMGAPEVWQLTDHVILSGQEFKLTLSYIKDAWQGGDLSVKLYYDIGNGIREPLKTVKFNQNDAEYVLSLSAAQASAGVGYKIGISLNNPATRNDSWTEFDDVKLYSR